MTALAYLPDSMPYTARVTDTPASGRTISGYGKRLPTPYMLQCADGLERRVYAICYGNAASMYVRVHGARTFLSIDAESACERAAQANR